MHSSSPGRSQPVLPTLRVTPAVETRDYHDFVLADRVDDAVWEAPQYRSPRFAMHHRVEHRIASDGFDAGIQDAQELDVESLTPRLVPLGCLVDLEIRFRAEDEPARHPNRWCSRVRTSSQGIAASGLRPCSARRMRSGTLNLSNSSRGVFITCQDYPSTTTTSTAKITSETPHVTEGSEE